MKRFWSWLEVSLVPLGLLAAAALFCAVAFIKSRQFATKEVDACPTARQVECLTALARHNYQVADVMVGVVIAVVVGLIAVLTSRLWLPTRIAHKVSSVVMLLLTLYGTYAGFVLLP